MLELEAKNFDSWEREPLTWSDMCIESVELPSLKTIEYKFQSTQNYIAIHDLIISDGEIRCGRLSNETFRDLRKLLTYAPKDHVLNGWGTTSYRKNTITTLTFDPALVENELEKANLKTSQEVDIYFRNTLIEGTMKKLVDASLGRYFISSIHAETLALLVSIEMGIAKDSASIVRQNIENRLSLRHSGIIKEYINENLNSSITLTILANLVGLSRFYFIRSFKATFGLTPYKYINFVRIEKSKEMLSKTDLPISVISDACGLRPLAHFSAAFRRATGLTPSQFRAQTRTLR